MNRTILRAAAVLLLVVGVGAVACTAEGDGNTGAAGQQVKDVGADLKKSATDAWASLTTDSDRLVDRVQTRNDADAKKELLDRCRDAQERLKKANSGSTDRATKLCDRIRDADVNTPAVWNDIKNELKAIGGTISGS